MCESKYGTYSSSNFCIKVVVEGIQGHFLLNIQRFEKHTTKANTTQNIIGYYYSICTKK
jgi:hypothetical protein